MWAYMRRRPCYHLLTLFHAVHLKVILTKLNYAWCTFFSMLMATNTTIVTFLPGAGYGTGQHLWRSIEQDKMLSRAYIIIELSCRSKH